MNKSLVFDFLGLYKAILRDISLYYPGDQVEWDRDIQRLTRLYRTRGQSTFTIDLPALGKHLDFCLSAEAYQVPNETLNLAAPRNGKEPRIPRLFWGLWSRIFDEGGLIADMDPNAVLFLRTVLYVGKNLEWSCAPRYLFEATHEFVHIEGSIPSPSPIWDGDGSLPPARLNIGLADLLGGEADSMLPGTGWNWDRKSVEPLLQSIQRSADRIAGMLGEFNPDEFRFRHGPGAVSDLGSGSYKYSFPSWGERLGWHFPYDRYAVTGIGLLDAIGPDGIGYCSSEQHSKLIAVPKTQKGPRLIAAEPTCNQWVQQCIRDFVYTRVRSSSLGVSIRFHEQDANRSAAREGSLTGELATIDLKSASDRLSCWLVERIFRANTSLLGPMIASRTRYLFQDIDKKLPSHIKLKKFSTQGSALTFPIQSLVFLAIVLGVGKLREPRKTFAELQERVHIFGDDIVAPRDWVASGSLTFALELLGLKVNTVKTFFSGYFRESCGMDAYKGWDVTPPHVSVLPDKSNPRSVASNVAISNNFFLKGFWCAASWLEDHLPSGSLLTVGTRSGQFGLQSFTGAPIPTKTRWNQGLQRDEALCLVVSARSRRKRQDSAAAILQYFTEEPAPYVKYSNGIAVAGVPVFKHAWVPVELLG